MASFAARARNLKRHLSHSSADLRGVLSEPRINELCRTVGHSWRDCFWRPTIVILTFLRQVLLPACSCRQTVACTLADPALAPAQRPRPAADPSAYSQARQRLPRALLERLARELSDQLAEPDRRWRGHRVRVVDGTGVSMPDTPELQAVFPQPATQAPGCGFPVARLLAVFCWCSGALLELLVDDLHVGELTLFRRLLAAFEPQDVVLADRLYGNYAELAELQSRGVHAVCRVNRARRVDLRQGTRLGPHDRRMVWQKPKDGPADLTPQHWAPLPDRLTVRVVRITTECRRAFRQHRIDIVTTLLDPVDYPPEALGELYRERWLAELNLRSLKTTLGMDVLRCRSPEMVRKELAIFHVVYNSIRLLMMQAARAHQVDPHRLSFAGTRQRLLAWLPRGLVTRGPANRRNPLRQLEVPIRVGLGLPRAQVQDPDHLIAGDEGC